MEVTDTVKIASREELWGRTELSGSARTSFTFAEATGTERTRKIRSLKIIINVQGHAS